VGGYLAMHKIKYNLQFVFNLEIIYNYWVK
jgi:hypothetical protein